MEEARTSNEPQQSIDELQKEFERLCDEQDQLPTEGFAQVFEVLDGLEEAFTPQHPYTENEEAIDKALEITGHSTDEAFCKAFKRNNQIIIRGKEIQEEILSSLPTPQGITLKMITGANIDELQIQAPPKMGNGEWLFYPINIVAPPHLMNIIDDIIQRDGEQGKGLFANHTDIPEEDEAEDELLMIDAFGLKCSLLPYWDELKKYKVVGDDGFLKGNFKKELLIGINQEVFFVKDNTDKPARIKNHITQKLKVYDEIPVWGIFFQILILQGLCSWLEEVPLNEGDNGYKEAQSLYNWITERLLEKLTRFCLMSFGNGDKQMLKPLCDYLYTTKAGKAIQAHIANKIHGKAGQDKNTQVIEAQSISPEPQPLLTNKLKETGDETKNKPTPLPEVLNTNEAKSILQKAINAGFCDANYQWGKTKALLAYFADRVSEYLELGKGEYDGKAKTSWKPFESLFGISGLSGAKRDYQKTGTLPDGYKDVDTLFE